MKLFRSFSFGIFLMSLITGCAATHPAAKSAKGHKDVKDASYYFLLSEMEMRKNNLPKATEAINEALQIDSSQSRFWYKRAFLQAAQGDLKAAESDVTRALELDPDDAEAWILLGKIHQSQDRRPQAIAAYRQAIRHEPSSEEANTLMLETLVGQKAIREASAHLARWEKSDPENTTPFFYEAWLAQNFLKSPTGAITAYQKVLNLEPDNQKALSSLAELYIAQKNDRKALDIFRQMEALQPNDISLKLKLALIYYEQKQYDQAVAKFEDLLRTHPDEDRIVYYLGVVYENLKKDEAARGEFSKIKVDSTFYKDARLHLAFLEIRAARPTEAIEVLKEAISRRPALGAFYEYLAQIYRDQKNESAAIDILEKGLKKSPEKELLYYALGLIHDKLGRFEDCIKAMKQVLKINPQNASALNYVGYSYADHGLHLDEAVDMLQRAHALKPDDGYITDSLGWVYYQKGDLDEALKFIQQAYTMVPGEPTIAEHLGDLLRKKGDRASALRYYRESAAGLMRKKDDEAAAKDLIRVRGKMQEIQS